MKCNFITRFSINYTSSEFEAISPLTGHLTNQKAGLEHSSLHQHSNTCDAAQLCKTNTMLILCWAETVKNSSVHCTFLILTGINKYFCVLCLLLIFTKLILLQSTIKALNCYTWTTKWLIKASCSSALSNFSVRSCFFVCRSSGSHSKESLAGT